MGTSIPAALRAVADLIEAEADGLLSYARAAKRLDCSRQVVGRLVASGDLDGVKLGPHGRRVTAASIDRLIKRRLQ